MTTPSIPALLEPIQERLNAATPGPWVIGKDRMERAILAGPYKAFLIAKVGDVRNPLLEDNAKLIANAPTDTARLLAAVKAVSDLADAWQARGEHLLKHASEREFPDGVAESLSESGAEFVHSAKLVRSAVEAALRGEA